MDDCITGGAEITCFCDIMDKRAQQLMRNESYYVNYIYSLGMNGLVVRGERVSMMEG